MKSIDEWAFSGCSLLTSIIIPSSVTWIDKRAFASCSSLTSIIIPDSVTSISEWAFDECSSLISVLTPTKLITLNEVKDTVLFAGYVFPLTLITITKDVAMINLPSV